MMRRANPTTSGATTCLSDLKNQFIIEQLGMGLRSASTYHAYVPPPQSRASKSVVAPAMRRTEPNPSVIRLEVKGG